MRKKSFIRLPYPNQAIYVNVESIKKFFTFTNNPDMYVIRVVYEYTNNYYEDLSFATLHEQQEFFNKLKKCFRILE